MPPKYTSTGDGKYHHIITQFPADQAKRDAWIGALVRANIDDKFTGEIHINKLEDFFAHVKEETDKVQAKLVEMTKNIDANKDDLITLGEWSDGFAGAKIPYNKI